MKNITDYLTVFFLVFLFLLSSLFEFWADLIP
jgi:hypothetical protein